MKNIVLVNLVVGTILLCGCSSMRPIKVSIIDHTTKLPVRNATVATAYSPAPYSLASCWQDIAVTGTNGRVQLQANYLKTQPTLYGYTKSPLAPFICVESQDYGYIEYFPPLGDEEKIILIELKPRGKEPRNADDLWIQPNLLRRIGSNIRDSWHRLIFKPGKLYNATNHSPMVLADGHHGGQYPSAKTASKAWLSL